MAFKDSLKNLRELCNLSQEELGKRMQLSKSTISMYENGNRFPDEETLEAFSDFFNVDMNYLMGKQKGSTYYLNPETAKMAQDIHDNPQYRVLFDAARGLKPESIEEIKKFIDYQKAKEEGEKNE